MMKPHFQASAIAWPVLHKLKATSISVLFFPWVWLLGISGCQKEF